MLALFGLPVPVMLFGAIVVAVVLALITERAAFRPLRSADPTTLLISSFAVSFFLQKLLILVVGSRLKGLDFLPALGRQVELVGVRLQLLQIATILVSAVLLVALTWFLRSTRLGLQMRAAAEDFRMARVLGVRANRVIAMAFALSGILAAAVSCLIVVQTGVVQPRMGLQLVVIAFVGTVIGGLGSLTGAALGGFLVGAASILLQALLPPDLRVFREAFVFVAVALVLLFRPQGLIPARGLQGADLMPPVDDAKARNYGILPRLWPLVALLAIVVVIVLCASFAPVVLQRRATQGLINLVAVVGLYVFVGNSGVLSFGNVGVHGGGRLRLGALDHEADGEGGLPSGIARL